MLEGSGAFQRDLKRLEEWAHVNLMKVMKVHMLKAFNKARSKVLHKDQDNLKYHYRLEDEWIESSPAEKDLGILVNKKLNMSCQCVLAAQKVNRILGCIRSVASGLSEMRLPLYLPLVRPHCIHLGDLQYKKNMDLLE